MESGWHRGSALETGATAWFCLPVRACHTVLLLLLLSLQGCAVVYKSGGDVLAHYGRTEMTPYMLGYDDIEMTCRGGLVMTPILDTLGALRANTDKLAVFTWSMAGLCAEQQALEQELRFYRAAHRGDHAEAEDARTLQKRFSRLAAKRFFRSYQYLITEYGDPEDGICPSLRREFDELVYMVGTISGVQALMHDTVADFTVSVPRDVASKADHAATCINGDRWWGLPDGIRAAIWTVLPMLAPEDADPWEELERVVRLGDEAGVRLNGALYVMAAYSAGEPERIRRAIRDFAANQSNVNRDYTLLDAMAEVMVTSISDRLWSEAVGQRTPYGKLGDFWDDHPGRRPDAPGIDDLFD